MRPKGGRDPKPRSRTASTADERACAHLSMQSFHSMAAPAAAAAVVIAAAAIAAVIAAAVAFAVASRPVAMPPYDFSGNAIVRRMNPDFDMSQHFKGCGMPMSEWREVFETAERDGLVKWNDKIWLHGWCAEHKIRGPVVLHWSRGDYRVEAVLASLQQDRTYVVKPSHLSRSKHVYAVRSGRYAALKHGDKADTPAWRDFQPGEIDDHMRDAWNTTATWDSSLQRVPPGVMVEEYVDNATELSLHCVWGEPLCVLVDKGGAEGYGDGVVDVPLGATAAFTSRLPAGSQDCLEAARRICALARVDYVRLDFCYDGSAVALREFTWNPGKNSIKNLRGWRSRFLSHGYSVARLYSPCAFPVDAVVTWVDSTDATGRAQREKYPNPHPGEKPQDQFTNSARPDAELRVCLGGIIQNLPWIRKIWLFVSRPQFPECLQPGGVLHHEAARVHVVYHDEAARGGDRDALPLFNSHAIEGRLARIPGLAEHFVYFNDDCFVFQPMSWLDFFDGAGRGLVRASRFRPSIKLSSKSAFDRAWGRLYKALRRTGKVYRQDHFATPLRKSTMAGAERLLSNEWAKTLARRWRSPADIPPVGAAINHGIRGGSMVLTMPLYETYEQHRRADQAPIRSIINADASLVCINALHPETAPQACGQLERTFIRTARLPRMGSARRLMLVAHPDDELIFGHDWITSPGPPWFVVCATYGTPDLRHGNLLDAIVRKNEFSASMAYFGIREWAMLRFHDGKEWDTDKLGREIAEVIRANGPFEVIVTHGPDGEYGHKNHIACYDALRGLATSHFEKRRSRRAFTRCRAAAYEYLYLSQTDSKREHRELSQHYWLEGDCVVNR